MESVDNPSLTREGTPSKQKPVGPLSARRKLLVFSTYAFYLLALVSIASLLPALKEEHSWTDADMFSITALTTFGQAAGKVAWGGWPVDKLGPRRTLWPSLLIMAALVFSLSFDPSEPRVIGWIGALTEFVATPVWPAHIQFVRRWWPEKEHSQGFSILGAASRSGDIASKLLYMALLSKMSWQHAAWVGAAIAVGVSASVFVFHADSPHKRNERPDVQMTPAAVVDMLKRMACSASFWQAVLASSTLCIVKQTGERNLPLFFTGGMRMSIGASAGLAFVWPVGFIISVMGIGSWFNQLSPPGKTRLVFAMTSVSTVAMFSIGWIVSSWPKDEDPSAFSRIVVVALVIIVATGVGLPYYVPSGVFAAQFGGEQAGVVSAYLDGTSALATGMFLKLLSSLVKDGWGSVWLLLGTVGIVMTVASTYFVHIVYTVGLKDRPVGVPARGETLMLVGGDKDSDVSDEEGHRP